MLGPDGLLLEVGGYPVVGDPGFIFVVVSMIYDWGGG